MLDGQLAWRQHDGGHTDGPNWKYFIPWARSDAEARGCGQRDAVTSDGRPHEATAGSKVGLYLLTRAAAFAFAFCICIARQRLRLTVRLPRTDQNSQIAHKQLLDKARHGRIDVYFEGDSITRRWGATDYPEFLANWKQNFFGWNAANFGWGADTVQNILWRLQNGELDNVHPKVIVLLAGTNNIGNATPPARR